jgi:methionyl-tRNA synthetase
MKEKIKFEEFVEIDNKLEVKAGKIFAAERIPKSKKLLKLSVRFGKDDTRTVVTNLGETYEPEDLITITTLFITNLEPTTMMGVLSEAMILPGVSVDNTIEFDLYTPGTKFFK